MNKIISKRQLHDTIVEYVFDAPKVVKNAKAGQFVIVIADEKGERVPFSICDTDKDKGTLTLLIQTIGATTMKLAALNEGDSVTAILGPLGNGSDIEKHEKAILIGGGIGCADIYPQAKKLMALGKPPAVIIGARNKGLIMYEDKFREQSGSFHITTDDGSHGRKGFVTDVMKELIESGEGYDVVFAVGPLPMMRAVSNLAAQHGLSVVVSLNSMMVDGTGMCGCCRLTVDGKTKYACVDGPEFDGTKVDWAEAMNRSRVFKEIEEKHVCRLTGQQR